MDTTPDDQTSIAIAIVEAELLPVIRSIPWTRDSLDVMKRQLQFTADIRRRRSGQQRPRSGVSGSGVSRLAVG